MSNWNYHDKPTAGGDARKIVTLMDGSMVWVGIRAWNDAERQWYNGNDPEKVQVLAWMDLPQPAPGRWVHGQLIETRRAHEAQENAA